MVAFGTIPPHPNPPPPGGREKQGSLPHQGGGRNKAPSPLVGEGETRLPPPLWGRAKQGSLPHQGGGRNKAPSPTRGGGETRPPPPWWGGLGWGGEREKMSNLPVPSYCLAEWGVCVRFAFPWINQLPPRRHPGRR